MSAAVLLMTFLGFFRNYSNPAVGRCIESHLTQIANNAAEGERLHGVPAGVMLVVGFMETHLGCDRNEGGNWGAPIDPQHRHTAGTPLQAAHALAVSYQRCGGQDWARAVGRFRSGLCAPSRVEHRIYVHQVGRLVRRLYTTVGQPVPAGF